MKTLLTIIIVSIIIVALVFILNAASFDGIKRSEGEAKKTLEK